MNLPQLAVLSAFFFISLPIEAAEQNEAQQVYQWMKQLEGQWTLSPASTVQEDLLPGTERQMVTMYHCRDDACSAVKATHYCVKQNQPQLLASLDSSADKLMFECDMSTDLCQSWDDHVHQITHELTEDGKHLKTVYSSFMNGEHTKDTVYHFDRK
jgi:hypothetical protein